MEDALGLTQDDMLKFDTLSKGQVEDEGLLVLPRGSEIKAWSVGAHGFETV